MNAGIGSIDFTAAARSVLLVGKDPDDDSKRAVVQTKNNLAPHGGAIGYELKDGQFFWTGASDLTATRILSAVADEETRSGQIEAAEFLRVALASGARPANEVKREAYQAGLTEQMLRTARRRLGVHVFKSGGYFGSTEQRWMWELKARTEDVAEDAEDVSKRGNQHLQANSDNKNTYGNSLAEDVDSRFANIFSHPQATSSGDIVIPASITDEEYARQYDTQGESRDD